MAKAVAYCKCEKCGEEFVKENRLMSRSAADNWTEWAEANITICPKCWSKAKREKDEKRYDELKDELRLPEITGKSDKQIAFANDLRIRCVARNAERLREVRREIDGVSAEEVAEVMAEKKTDEDGALRKIFDRRMQYAHYVVLTTSSARELIDLLHRG